MAFSLSSFLSAFNALLPLLEAGAAVFIHPGSDQTKFAMTVGEVNTVAAVATAIAGGLAPVPVVAGAESTVKVS